MACTFTSAEVRHALAGMAWLAWHGMAGMAADEYTVYTNKDNVAHAQAHAYTVNL